MFCEVQVVTEFISKIWFWGSWKWNHKCLYNFLDKNYKQGQEQSMMENFQPSLFQLTDKNNHYFNFFVHTLCFIRRNCTSASSLAALTVFRCFYKIDESVNIEGHDTVREICDKIITACETYPWSGQRQIWFLIT